MKSKRMATFEKLEHVVRLRLTDELRSEIRRYMAEDDRESFDECCRHLIRFALKIKLGGGASNGQVVERRDGKEQIPNWSGLERRKGSR